MDFKPGEFDEYVDTVLRHFQSGEEALIYSGIDLVSQLPTEKAERNIFRNFLIEEGLLRIERESNEKKNPYCTITVKGYKIIYSGGWKEYIKYTKDLEKLKNDLVKSSIQTNRRTVYILIATAVISLFGIINSSNNNSELLHNRIMIDTLSRQLQSVKLQVQSQKILKSSVPDSVSR